MRHLGGYFALHLPDCDVEDLSEGIYVGIWLHLYGVTHGRYYLLQTKRYLYSLLLTNLCGMGTVEAGKRGHPLKAGHHTPSMTCRNGLTTLPGHGQRVNL